MRTPKKSNSPLTRELLQQYRDAALANAQELLEEAALLLRHDHHARAYFLAVASIEEVGKAVQACDGMGRNLKDPAVSTRLQLQFADHALKIISAFVPWLRATPHFDEDVMSAVHRAADLKDGREPSMYTDIHVDGPRIMTPSTSIRKLVAENCVHLAQAVLVHARPYAAHANPQVKTRVQDEYFALQPAKVEKMLSRRDFLEYYLSRIQAGDIALETAVITYHKNYFSKDLQFKVETSGTSS